MQGARDPTERSTKRLLSGSLFGISRWREFFGAKRNASLMRAAGLLPKRPNGNVRKGTPHGTDISHHGGADFIGSHLTEALLARGDRMVVLDHLSTGNLEELA